MGEKTIFSNFFTAKRWFTRKTSATLDMNWLAECYARILSLLENVGRLVREFAKTQLKKNDEKWWQNMQMYALYLSSLSLSLTFSKTADYMLFLYYLYLQHDNFPRNTFKCCVKIPKNVCNFDVFYSKLILDS